MAWWSTSAPDLGESPRRSAVRCAGRWWRSTGHGAPAPALAVCFRRCTLREPIRPRSPFRGYTVPAAVACGLLSVLDDIAPVFAEVCRVMTPAGRFAVVDLVSASSDSVRIGSRVYPPAEGVARSIIASGFDLVDEAIGLTSLSDWALADEQVGREVARRRRGELEFEHWLDDRRRLERLMSSDRIVMAGFAAITHRSNTGTS